MLKLLLSPGLGSWQLEFKSLIAFFNDKKCVKKKPAESYILSIIFHRHLYSPVMSTASNQVGATLFPSFLHIFYHFTFPGFPFILIIVFFKFWIFCLFVTWPGLLILDFKSLMWGEVCILGHFVHRWHHWVGIQDQQPRPSNKQIKNSKFKNQQLQ